MKSIKVKIKGSYFVTGIRPPKVFDVLDLGFTEITSYRSMVKVISRCTSLTEEQLVELSLPEFTKLTDAMTEVMNIQEEAHE